MRGTITCAEYLLGLSMTLFSLSTSVAKQSADLQVLIVGVTGIILLLLSLRDGLEAGRFVGASLFLLSLAITAVCVWQASAIHPPRALLVALPIGISISTVSLALLLRSP